jgi:ATP adenylyltransferase
MRGDEIIMTDATQLPCLFCKPPGYRIFFRAELVIGLWDAYPVSPGHALLIPRRHVPTWFEASVEERGALIGAIDAAKAVIEREHRPNGYNIGINCGAAAGQTIFHLHIHLIPRFLGDVADPRGGVRHVMPDKANYLSSNPGSISKPDSPPK